MIGCGQQTEKIAFNDVYRNVLAQAPMILSKLLVDTILGRGVPDTAIVAAVRRPHA